MRTMRSFATTGCCLLAASLQASAFSTARSRPYSSFGLAAGIGGFPPSTNTEEKEANVRDTVAPPLAVLERRILQTEESDVRDTTTTSDPILEDHTAAAAAHKKKATILFLLWCIALLSSLDRVAMSVAIVPIANEFQWNDGLKGSVSSFFSLGYGLGIVPSGLILANVSGTLVMGIGMVVWSLATIFTPLGVDGSFAALCALRVLVGIGESIVIPTVQRTLSVWTDASEKSRALAFVFSGFATGTVLAYLASPVLMDMTGGSWRSLFQVYGSIGLFLVIPWWLLAQDSPSSEVRSPTSEFSLAQAPWKDFAQSPGVWGMLLAHAAKNWGLYNNLAWTPTFYAEQYGLSVADSAWLSVLPSIAGAVGGGVAGVAADSWLSSRPYQNIEEITRLRKLFQCVAFLGPAVALAFLAHDIPDKAITAQWFLMITVGLQSFHAAGFEAGNQEKAGPKWAGLLYSVTSLPAVFFGTFGVWVTGQILDVTNQDWSVIFAVNAVVNVLGAAAFFKLFDSKREFD